MRTLPVLAPALLVTGLLAAPAYAAAPTCDGRAATIVGTDGPDRIRGTSGADVIVALGGDDRVRASGGDDVVCGGRGADVLVGGAGDDRLFGQRDRYGVDRGGTFLVGDTLRGGPGADHLNGGYDDRTIEQVGAGQDVVDYSDAPSAVVVDLETRQVTGAGTGPDHVVWSRRLEVHGSAYGDVLTGSSGPDTLVGLGGPDRIDGAAGDDTLFAETTGGEPRPDRDVLHGGPGDDTLLSYKGSDRLHGDDGDDELDAYSGAASQAYGGPGDDSVSATVTRSSGWVADGGSGRNELDVSTSFARAEPRATVTVDLRGDTSGAALPSPSTGSFTGFRKVYLSSEVPWSFVGTDGPERLETVEGGPLHALMGGGDDVVYGSLDGGDRIDGGDGDDHVDADGTCTHVESGSCRG